MSKMKKEDIPTDMDLQKKVPQDDEFVANECVANECVANECVANECVANECVANECVAGVCQDCCCPVCRLEQACCGNIDGTT